MAVNPAHFVWLAIGLVLVAGFGLTAARPPAPAALPVADSRGCTSCDARHAGLARHADLLAQTAEGAE